MPKVQGKDGSFALERKDTSEEAISPAYPVVCPFALLMSKCNKQT